MDTTLLTQVEEQDVIEVIGEDLDLPREIAELLNKKGDLNAYFADKLNTYYDKICSREKETEWQEEVDYIYPLPWVDPVARQVVENFRRKGL